MRLGVARMALKVCMPVPSITMASNEQRWLDAVEIFADGTAGGRLYLISARTGLS